MEDKTMTLIKWSKDPLMAELMNYGMNRFGNRCNTCRPAANILEKEDGFGIELMVPGMKKEDFKIDLDKDILTISAEAEQENVSNYTRREFGIGSFSRSFSIPESINTDEIKAEYNDGILKLHLPKKEEARAKPARTIEIS